MEALDGLPEAAADLGEFLRAEDERGDSCDHDELRDPEAEHAAAPEAPVAAEAGMGPERKRRPREGHPLSAAGEERGVRRAEGKGLHRQPSRARH